MHQIVLCTRDSFASLSIPPNGLPHAFVYCWYIGLLLILLSRLLDVLLRPYHIPFTGIHEQAF